ncbi:protein Mis18-beta-like [Scleropages formosus]|uniref:Protein Mis18-beta-like n=1 Tax=Scleropages formosus TaxID=113540 RepID=A0A0P7V0I4_SCLFO|nr:protein Mis18-beta-like [Scleropages formosus]
MAHERYGKKKSNGSPNASVTYKAKCEADTSQCSELINSVLSSGEEALRTDYRRAVVLYCAVCSAVWSDSLEVCGEHEQLNSIVCLRVTKDVVVKEELEFRLEGRLEGWTSNVLLISLYSTYNALHCSGCQCFVGVVLNSTPKHLSALRSLFLLQKENINCYVLKTGAIVKASSVTFKSRNTGTNLDELKQEMDSIAEQMSRIERKLKRGKSYSDG